MKSLLFSAVLGIAFLTPSTPARAQAPGAAPPATAAPPAKNDYSDEKNWLCRPGRHDACDVDLSNTIVAADGTLTREEWKSDPNAPIDCFYVYPTVSSDPTEFSDMTPNAAELNVTRMQFARFGSKCRLYAPSYRQITLAGLRRVMAGGQLAFDRGLQYDDVVDAWQYYLEHDNNGRGVVLVGHSQGSFILMGLIAKLIDGKPIQSRLISAIIPGATVPVAKGKDVGGAFKSIPICRSATQLGCVIAFSAFRSTIPPPQNTLFGAVPDPAMSAACANPAALAGGSGVLHAYLSTTGSAIVGNAVVRPWTTPTPTPPPTQPIATPWVSVPGLLTAECATNEYATYLKITVNANPADARTDDITGDLMAGGVPQANWGLHLVDVGLTIGNFVEIVDAQTKAYLAKTK